MTAWRRLLLALIGIEVLGAAILTGRRLDSTSVRPPLVDQYNDSETGRELLALPDEYLFDSAAKWRALGEAYMTFGYFAKADSCLRHAVEAAPRDAEAALAHGFVLERLGKIDEAVEVFERAAKSASGPLSQMAWHHVGRNRLRLERAEDALAAFEAAGEDHDPSVYQRAKWLVRSGRAAEAVPLLDALSDNYPHDLHVLSLRGMAADQLGRKNEAETARDELDRAESQLKLDDLDELFKPLRSRFGLARQIAVAVKQQHADLSLAAASMEQLVRDQVRWQNSYLFLLQDVALVQLKSGRPDVAIRLAEQQIDRMAFPTATMWEVVADVAWNRGEESKAREALAHAERLLPASSQYFKLAEIAKKTGDGAGYSSNLSQSKMLDARTLFRARQYEEARLLAREAVQLNSKLAEGWFILGESHRKLQQPGPARTAYRRCLELDQDHGRAGEGLKRLSFP